MFVIVPPLPDGTLTTGYDPRKGLSIAVDGVSIVQGSWFQFYAPNWTKDYYSSRWNDAKVTAVGSGSNIGFDVVFTSPDGLASGTIEVRRAGPEITAKYRLLWKGDAPALVELTAAELAAEPFRGVQPSIVGGGSPSDADKKSFGRRLIASNADRIAWSTTPLQVGISTSAGTTAFDAKGYSAEWATGRSLDWVGNTAIPLTKDEPKEVTVSYRIEGGFLSGKLQERVSLKPIAGTVAGPPIERLPLVPRPLSAQLDYEHPLEITGLWNMPAGRPRRFDDLMIALKRRFLLPPPVAGAPKVTIDGGMSKLKKRIGAYRITITPKSLSMIGEEDEGLLNAVERIAQLAYAQDGKLYLPTGQIQDEPRRTFRGVHLFVGPQALNFQRTLWSRVLRPMMLNNVVLQCERTAWESTPGIQTAMTMPREDLIALVKWYRAQTVEPTPLVQSWGHMEWLFANGRNLELARNPEVPYAIDPALPGTAELMAKLWKEVATITKAKALHFGLDEVDMRGVPKDPKAITAQWREYIPVLGKIAQENDAKMMLWGDEALDASSAPDAANAPNRSEAQSRRDVIPRGSYIADWHYKADARPGTFTKSLQTWQNDGQLPIASTWYRPENVRGFTLAADLTDSGTLQTTWAGYESNEANMLAAMPQFVAMILSADYSWSGRQDDLSKLPYSPTALFRRLYFGEPMPLTAAKGFTLGPTRGVAPGPATPEMALQAETGVSALQFSFPLRFRGFAENASAPTSYDIDLAPAPAGKRIYLLLSTENRAGDGDPLATVEAIGAIGVLASNEIRYGLDVRSAEDTADTFRSPSEGGLSLYRLSLPATEKITKLRVRASNPATGLVIRGMTIL